MDKPEQAFVRRVEGWPPARLGAAWLWLGQLLQVALGQSLQPELRLSRCGRVKVAPETGARTNPKFPEIPVSWQVAWAGPKQPESSLVLVQQAARQGAQVRGLRAALPSGRTSPFD